MGPLYLFFSRVCSIMVTPLLKGLLAVPSFFNLVHSFLVDSVLNRGIQIERSYKASLKTMIFLFYILYRVFWNVMIILLLNKKINLSLGTHFILIWEEAVFKRQITETRDQVKNMSKLHYLSPPLFPWWKRLLEFLFSCWLCLDGTSVATGFYDLKSLCMGLTCVKDGKHPSSDESMYSSAYILHLSFQLDEISGGSNADHLNFHCVHFIL